MGYICRLEYGGAQINLAGGEYSLMPDFRPPAVDITPAVAVGTTSNVWGGGTVTGIKAMDRQWTFTVKVTGASSAAIHESLRRLQAFLDQSYDRAETLYLAYRPDDAHPYEPEWGTWGQLLRYQIKAASVRVNEDYGIADYRGRYAWAEVATTIAPVAVGKQMALLHGMNGTGQDGAIEDRWGAADGSSRGIIIPTGTTNLVSNPVFGHATPLTNWTAGTGCTTSFRAPAAYKLFGYTPVSVTFAAANQLFGVTAITIPASGYYASFYIRRADNGAISASDFYIRYNSADNTPTVYSFGNGWYLVYCSLTGTAGSTSLDLKCRTFTGVEYFIAGAQVEATELTYLAYGELPGCGWSGTAHASSTVRTTGPIFASSYQSAGSQLSSGTVVIAFRPDFDVSGKILASFGPVIASKDNLTIAISSNTVILLTRSDSTTFSYTVPAMRGSTHVLHITYTNVTATAPVLYIDGVAIAASGSAPSTPASDYDVNLMASNVAILALSVYRTQFTAAQIVADYANLAQALTSGRGINGLPYYVIASATATTASIVTAPTVIAGNIPGGAPADTSLVISSDNSKVYSLVLSHTTLRQPNYPTLFADGTGTADAAAYGGSCEQLTISTTPVEATVTATMINRNVSDLYGEQLYLYLVCRENTAISNNMNAAARIYQGTAASTTSMYRPIAATNSYLRFLVGPISFPELQQQAIPGTKPATFTVKPVLYRNSSSAAFNVDYMVLAIGKVCAISRATNTGSVYYVFSRGKVLMYDSSWNLTTNVNLTGDTIELEPNRYNVLQILPGALAIADATVTLSAIYVTPRYTLV